ncbi:pyridoxal phosphate-dependent aminotransferase [Parahaliea maris]|uniref:Aminotransferase n=1 Tax=Parahaliea maris TaxID=2716870 RepID=A0A5C9A647_9GAMM|nr:pyridoxal phosphate-dependent aminotransferase [Parahaliea maris]TXS95240.1 pyridoxal phosphate-dependent aminotransferase [Parahaliea maris]
MNAQSSLFDGDFSALTRRLQDDAAGVWAVHDRACERFEAGEEVYLLSVGDPDLATPPRVVQAGIDALHKGRTHYAPGRGERHLRETIAGIETRASGKPCDPDEVVVFPGATNAIYSVLACLVDPGDEVVVAEPMYIGYEGIFRALNISKAGFALDADAGFAFRLEAVKAAITERTRVVFINTPGNPAGNMIGESELRELAAFCRERNIWLVCDEVYSMITFDGPHVSLRRAAAQLDNVVVIDGLSKSHAMTGWRLGWTVSSRLLADRLLDFTSSTIFGCCQFVQDAAAFALTNDEEYIQGVREEYRVRRDYVCQRVTAIAGLSCDVPPAGMFVMIDVGELGVDGEQFADQLLAAEGVSVLPGIGFGENCRWHVRVSLAQPISVLRPAFDRIARFVAP